MLTRLCRPNLDVAENLLDLYATNFATAHFLYVNMAFCSSISCPLCSSSFAMERAQYGYLCTNQLSFFPR